MDDIVTTVRLPRVFLPRLAARHVDEVIFDIEDAVYADTGYRVECLDDGDSVVFDVPTHQLAAAVWGLVARQLLPGEPV